MNNGVSEHIICKNIDMTACRPLQTVRANQDKSTGSVILPPSVGIVNAPLLIEISPEKLSTNTQQFQNKQNAINEIAPIPRDHYLCIIFDKRTPMQTSYRGCERHGYSLFLILRLHYAYQGSRVEFNLS